ncbi:MAG TPA: FN3 associated domain-containing protein, partial [Sedimentisphaerales bacterium]|nr:FN3 associated domain-containing protein [Sedimentisphaerales bacterium]
MPRCVKTSLLSLVLITFLAGLTSAQPQLVGDLNDDKVVDFEDLRAFSWQWLAPGCSAPDCAADMDGVNGVNMADFALFAANWQKVIPHIVISEFLASNASNKPPLPPKEGDLLDGHGESSDWIEIYNPTDAVISLDGWYLTDSNENRTKWQFPDGLEIKAGEFRIVFASEKTEEEYPSNYPYVDPEGYYHTNFELNKDGDYLALVTPDSNTVAHQYSPEFPTQVTDISYGLAQYATTLVPTGAIASYHVPTTSSDALLGTDWAGLDFDDSAWDTGPTSLGFGDVGSTGTILREYWTGIGGRDILALTSSPDYPDNPSGSSEPMLFEVPENWADDYGTRMHGFLYPPDNGSYRFWIASDDNSELWLSTDTNPANKSMIAFVPEWTNSREWNRYESQHSDWIALAAGQKYYIEALHKEGTSGDNLAVTWEGPGITGGYPIEGQYLSPWTDFWFATDVQNDMLGFNSSLWMRIEFDLEEGQSDLFDTLTLRMRYEDGFVAYLNGEKVAWGNAPDPVSWNSTALSDRPIEDSTEFEEFNLMAYLHLLQPGKNVLAIHGLNDSKHDGQFLVLPELVGAMNRSVPQYFARPTPGTFNIPGAVGRVSEVWFSTERTFYTGPPDWHILLTLSTSDDDAEIRYTVDGSRPTITHGNTYAGPLKIKETTTLRAVGVKAGWLDSDVETHTYIFVEDVIKQSPLGQPPGPNWPSGNVNGQYINYGMDPCVVDPYPGQVKSALKAIPTISLVTDIDNLFDSSKGIYVNAYEQGRGWERPVSVELINPDASEGFQIDAGLRIRGGYSRQDSNPKHAFRLFFRAEYGSAKLKFPLFGDEGVKEFDHVDLRTAQNYSWSFGGDSRNTMVREVFSRDVQRDMGQPYTRSRYYHLYINGHYWGLFQTQERSEASYAESYFGGDKDDYDVVKVETFTGYNIVATDGNLDAFYRLWEASIAGFGTDTAYYAVQGLNTDGTRNPNYEVLVDIDNLIDYMLCSYFVGDPDGPVSAWARVPNNFYGIYNRNGQNGFKFFRHDAEHSLDNVYENRLFTGTTIAVGSQFYKSNPLWFHTHLTDHPEYRMRFADRVHKYFFDDGVLTPEPSTARLMARANQINMAIIAESARWGDSKREPPLTKNDDWLPEINSLVNNYFPYRTGIVLNQFKSEGWYPNIEAPIFNQHGGEVPSGFNLTIDNNPSGTIYYTTDGSDPRKIGGDISSGAKQYTTGPVTLNKTTQVKARVWVNDSTWSALNETVFAVGPVVEDLRISEIMFNPRNTGNLNDPNAEYIELTNIGLDTLNLNLVRFTEGIHYTFPDVQLLPGGYILVVKNRVA